MTRLNGAGRKGDKVVKKRLASGEVRVYRYPRNGPRIALAGQGAIRSLAEAYTRSPEFKTLSARWQGARRHYLGILEDELGWLSIGHIQLRKARDDFYELRDRFAETPFMADKLMDTLRTLLAWGYERGKLDVNQGVGIKRLSPSGKTRNDKIWTEDREAIVYATFPPYLVQAFRFALFSGARQSDMCALRWEQYQDGWLTFQPAKTKAKTAVTVFLPVFALPPFQALIDSLSRSTEFILTTSTGQPLDATNLRARWRTELAKTDLAGEDLHWHDLRGTCATRLLEAGCSDAETASITGHEIGRGSSLSDYAARTKRLALSAYRKWSAAMAETPKVVQLTTGMTTGK